MRSDELHENIDVLEDEKASLEASFQEIRERVLSGKHLSETDYERLSDLKDEAEYLEEDIEHHLFRCSDECDPSEIAGEKARLDQLKINTKQLSESISKQLNETESAVTAQKVKKKEKAKKARHFVANQSGRIIKIGWRAGKDAFSKIDPLNKPVNKNDVSDHGVESLRLARSAYKTGKKTIKTTKSTIQTTEKSIKLAGNTVKTTYRTTKNTAVTTYRAVKATAIFIKDAVIALITVASSPVFWIVAAIAVVVVLIYSAVAMLLGGAADYEEQMRQAANDPVALADNVPEDIEDAVEYYRIACENHKTDFCDMINGYYFNIDDRKNSDLVYMKRNNPPAEWQKSYPTDAKKEQLRNAWDVSVIEPEALAIVYVLLERAENEANGTDMDIYPIEYTQEAFDDLLDKCCVVTEEVHERQECPGLDCSEEYDESPNPAYTTAYNAYIREVNAYNSFAADVAPKSAEYRYRIETQNATSDPNARAAMQSWVDAARNELTTAFRSWEAGYESTGWAIDEYMDINCQAWLGGFVENAWAVLQATDEVIRTPHPACAHEHDLHSVGLNIFNAEETMSLYHFTEAETQWAENLTQTYTAYFLYLEEGGG